MSKDSINAIKLLQAFLSTRSIKLTDDAFHLLCANLEPFSCDILASAIKKLMPEKIYGGDVTARLIQECQAAKDKSFEKLLLIKDNNLPEDTFYCPICQDCTTGTVSVVHPVALGKALAVVRDQDPMPEVDQMPAVASCAAFCSCSAGQAKKEAYCVHRYGETAGQAKASIMHSYGDAHFHINWLDLQREANERGQKMFETLIVTLHAMKQGTGGGQANRSSDLDSYTAEAIQ